MKVAEYLASFAGDLDSLILDLYDEMEDLITIRCIRTINGIQSLFRETDKKYRMIAVSIGADEDLFEDLARAYDPQIFRPCHNTTLFYDPGELCTG